jgi:hypothetical protein
MFTPIGRSRILPFPLYNQVTNGNTIDPVTESVAGSFVWPEDSTERVVFPLYISLDEYVAISSAIDVGADIAYPEQYIEVIHIWMRQGMDICQIIANCINDPDSPARQAVIDLATSSPDITNYNITNVQGMTTEQIASNVLDKGCDASDVAGAVIAIVDKFDEYITDALQIIELGTNDEERIASIIAGVPVFGALPVDEVIDVMQDILEDLAENYLAGMTPTWRDSVSEQLYCLALEQPDCKLTFALLYEYFQTRAVSGLDLFATVYDLANFITGGDFANDELVLSGMYAILLASLKTGSEFFGMEAPLIGAITRDALPSSAWEDWDECEPPPPPPGCVDFSEDPGTWDPSSGGTYETGIGFKGFYNSTFNASVLRALRDVESAVAEKIVYQFSAPVTNVLLYQPSGSFALYYTGAATDEIEYSADTFPGSWADVNLALGLAMDHQATGDITSSVYFVGVCIYNPE